MRFLRGHIPTLLFVLAFALAMTGAIALGAHDEVADDGLDIADEAQQTQGDVDTEVDPDVGPAVNGDSAGFEHGQEVSDLANSLTEDSCERGLAIADLASSLGNEGESRVADEAHDNCEDDGGEVDSLENGDDASGFGQDTAENAQGLEEGGGEEFGRSTANEASDGESDAGDAGADARDDGQQTGADAADAGADNAGR